MQVSLLNRGVVAVFVAVLLTACHPMPRPATHVEPLQLFGAEPELMPALGFEPLGGILSVSAKQSVFVTVVEIDPATQARTVVFPERGARPLRVSGEMSLQLELRRGDDPLPARGILVIASADSLVIAPPIGPRESAERGVGGVWAIPEVMPEQWAAVYVWPAKRQAASGQGR